MRYTLMTFVIVAVMAGPMVAEAQTEAAELDKMSAEQDRKMQEAEMKLEEAQRQLEEAAREMAELGIRTDANIEVFRHIRGGGRNKAMLGINIGADDGGSGAGVMVEGVTPGGPADHAGLKAGDVITKVGDTSLTAESSRASNRKLLDLMRDVEPGEDVKVVYQREGKSQDASVRTKAADAMAFGFVTDGNRNVRFGPKGPHEWKVEIMEDAMAPHAPMGGEFFRRWAGMELVSLTPELGEYFGTDKGLLVVRAPGQKDIDIHDGDVILEIGGRTPDSPAHATRILRSYQPGEKMTLQLIRKKKKTKVDITLPEREMSHWVQDGDEDIHEIQIAPSHPAPPHHVTEKAAPKI
ncbi:MAG: PDZ domain-containing protein [Gammaproteobacteria bacterium]|nr:PDZ domain-containing protein [Gammaproteobacteria bacterium]